MEGMMMRWQGEVEMSEGEQARRAGRQRAQTASRCAKCGTTAQSLQPSHPSNPPHRSHSAAASSSSPSSRATSACAASAAAAAATAREGPRPVSSGQPPASAAMLSSPRPTAGVPERPSAAAAAVAPTAAPAAAAAPISASRRRRAKRLGLLEPAPPLLLPSGQGLRSVRAVLGPLMSCSQCSPGGRCSSGPGDSTWAPCCPAAAAVS